MTCRRWFASFTVLVLVAAVVGPGSLAGAKPRTTRTVTGTYSQAGVHVVSPWAQPIDATVELPGGPERFVTVEVEDDSGEDTYAQISQDLDADGLYDLIVPICSSTALPVLVAPEIPVKVIVYQGPCYDGMPARASAGTVTATFTSCP